MKVKSIRLMLSADEDITEELDNVVCRLMKLSLRTSKEKQEPPSVSWMQLKLLDLLTLTENAISRRQKYYKANYPATSNFDKNIKEFVKDDCAAEMIVKKYDHLVNKETSEVFDDLDFGFEHELDEQHDGDGMLSKDFSPKSYVISVNNGEVSLVNENLELAHYANCLSDEESSKCAGKKYVRSPTRSLVKGIYTKRSRKRSHKISDDEQKSDENTSKRKKSKIKVAKKVRPKISSHSSLKINSKGIPDHKTYSRKSRKHKAPKKLQPSLSKPIPGSLIDLCHSEENTLLYSNNSKYQKKEVDIAATEKSVLINIVMDDMEETIALRRSIGTDPDISGEEIDQEQIICNVENEVNHCSFNNSPENVNSQTIFLFDINEPSTSKGVRHISMDVQCGTDTALPPNGEQMKLADPNILKATKPSNKSLIKATNKTVSSTITPKHIKSMRAAIKPSNCAKLPEIVNNDCRVKSEPTRKHIDYLPPYLRKKLFALKDKKQNSIDSSKIIKLKNIGDTERESLKKELNKASYTKLRADGPQSNIQYLVFRNEIETTNPSANASQSAEITNKNDSTTKRKGLHKRTSSPLSQTSSTCSTSDSITTVRQINNWNRASKRLSTSSNKSSLVNTDSETSPSTIKNRKFTKKFNKLNKKNDGKDQSNKENTPESSKNYCPEKQMCKSAFMSKSKNMIMSKIEDTSLATDDKYQTSIKSNIKIPAIESNDDKMKPRNSSKKKSTQANDSSSNEELINNHESIRSDPSNLVLLVESIKENNYMQEKKSQEKKSQHTEESVHKVVDSSLLTEWFERGKNSINGIENTEKAILAQMRQLVEEKLDFISGTLNDLSFEDNVAIQRTVIPTQDTDLNNTLKSEIENAMNRTLEAVISNDEPNLSLQHENITDADLISFKSVTSRDSHYHLADLNDDTNIGQPSQNKIANSVFDIFERKNLTSEVQNTPGTIAAQVFSGFSIDDTIIGDQPDYMNADSEVGVDVSRQATSEEMFLSGRSSYDTYETCVYEEEVDVPDWLFHAMNPQIPIDPDPVAEFDSETGSPSFGYTRLRTMNEDEEQPELGPLRMPIVQPVLDANGNIVEPQIGLDAGAGDGRGMHSDYSQDSSGRGSSLSSSDLSSSRQGEAILIDPSAYTNQFELFHEPVSSSMAVTTLVVPIGSTETGRHGTPSSPIVSTSRNAASRPSVLLTSDGEADVSSIDTDDIPDSS
ncbi:hypothetical protein O0L34_g12669 [Tuta absoluta]|nr:hypothetical protein O0L34_g12669 [Tuta absoluta]